MKCIHLKGKPDTVIKVKNEEAKHLVEVSNYVYCPKQVWKRLVRDKQKIS
jgi:hypothetical protein